MATTENHLIYLLLKQNKIIDLCFWAFEMIREEPEKFQTFSRRRDFPGLYRQTWSLCMWKSCTHPSTCSWPTLRVCLWLKEGRTSNIGWSAPHSTTPSWTLERRERSYPSLMSFCPSTWRSVAEETSINIIIITGVQSGGHRWVLHCVLQKLCFVECLFTIVGVKVRFSFPDCDCGSSGSEFFGPKPGCLLHHGGGGRRETADGPGRSLQTSVSSSSSSPQHVCGQKNINLVMIHRKTRNGTSLLWSSL